VKIGLLWARERNVRVRERLPLFARRKDQRRVEEDGVMLVADHLNSRSRLGVRVRWDAVVSQGVGSRIRAQNRMRCWGCTGWIAVVSSVIQWSRFVVII
jgi:hypothetical protein